MDDDDSLFEDEIEKVDGLMDRLAQIVSEDGKITEDEQALLENIIDNLKEYRMLLFDLTEDGEIDEQEEETLRSFRNRIVEDATRIAFQDFKYDEDEWKVIEELREFGKYGE